MILLSLISCLEMHQCFFFVEVKLIDRRNLIHSCCRVVELENVDSCSTVGRPNWLWRGGYYSYSKFSQVKNITAVMLTIYYCIRMCFFSLYPYIEPWNFLISVSIHYSVSILLFYLLICSRCCAFENGNFLREYLPLSIARLNSYDHCSRSARLHLSNPAQAVMTRN